MNRPEAALGCMQCEGTFLTIASRETIQHEGHCLEQEPDLVPQQRRGSSRFRKKTNATVEQSADYHMDQEVSLEREIPSFRMRPYKVVRLIPKRAAAPFGPMITPCVCRSVLQMCSRFKSSRVMACSELPCATGLNLARGEQRVWPRVRITLHSTKFCNSRMFPGQECEVRESITSSGILSIVFCIRAAYLATKCVTSKGMSSGRSRSGGTDIGNTLRR